MANAHPAKPFVKGDPRINRKGKPRDFTALRVLAQSLGNEPAVNKEGVPVVIDGHIATQAEMILRDMMHSNPERYLEIAYGKVPQPMEISGKDGGPIAVETMRPSDIAATVRALMAGNEQVGG